LAGLQAALILSLRFGFNSRQWATTINDRGEMSESENATATCQCGCRSRDGEMIEAIAKDIEDQATQVAKRLSQTQMPTPPMAGYFIDGMTRAARIARGMK
jgi:hypothetical protein